ncbi:hypothetical protein COEREDRAFT_89401 [Coemansia reversa NRRL 1564]|uniref:Uncharacterized protein n=1 Tax=Coemansia reversa (strain ATCC 12441 / NRRL 1564) TaxID=763665 RepID=A0A2G5B3Q6_COERN|nr:hypothetical protein COEREDRAFT_89401 [Coemansia reversa NRRL 1564]|eukprot:PIA13648.1 hypothetical protein COEREDRAFT_89401 [Coemansia reversa NRRL 1564]
MKLLTLSLAIVQVSLGALFSSEPVDEISQQEYPLLDRLNLALRPAGAQCQSNCEGGKNDNFDVASLNGGSGISDILSEFIRNFLQDKESTPVVAEEAVDADIVDSNHIIVDSTPLFELLYSYINDGTASSQTEKSVYSQSISAIDAESWMMASEKAASENLEATTYLKDFLAPTPSIAQSSADASITEYNFDFNSWGDRVDRAAHRLVSNVEGLIVHFLPTISSQIPLATAVDLDEVATRFDESFTATTNMIEENHKVIENDSIAHWFAYI